MGTHFNCLALIVVAVASSLLLAASTAASAQANDALYDPPKVDRSLPTPAPVYPPGAELRGEHGTTTIKLRVSAGGKPVRAVVESSSGFEDLDNAAVEAAMGWHFIPAMRDGETVSDWMTIDIKFQLPTLIQVPAPSKPEKDVSNVVCRNDVGITGTRIPVWSAACLSRQEWENTSQQDRQDKNEGDLKVLLGHQ